MRRLLVGAALRAASQAGTAVLASTFCGRTPSTPAGRVLSNGLAANRSHALMELSGPCANAGDAPAIPIDTRTNGRRMSPFLQLAHQGRAARRQSHQGDLWNSKSQCAWVFRTS